MNLIGSKIEIFSRQFAMQILSFLFLSQVCLAAQPRTPGIEEIRDFDFKAVLAEKETYEFVAGSNNFSGKATIQRVGSHFTIELPVFVFGASLFGQATKDEILRTNKYYRNYVSEEFFKVGAENFSGHAWLYQRVLKTLDEVEHIYSHPNLTLKIIPSFVQNEYSYYDLPGDEYKSANLPYSYFSQEILIEKLKANERINGKKMVLVFVPYSISPLMSPVGFDLYSPNRASLIAHEIGHILGVVSEAYTLSDYPLNGLMTAETQLELLTERCGQPVRSRLTTVDFFSILYAVLRTAPDGSVSREVLDKVRSQSIEAVYRSTVSLDGKGWYGMTGSERRKAVASQMAKKSERYYCQN